MKLRLEYHGVVYSKKNSKRIITNSRTRRPMIVSSNKAKEMERDMAGQFLAQYLSYLPKIIVNLPIATIHGRPLEVHIMIWQKDRTRRDLDNQATSILDALVAAGVILDDSVNVIQKLTIEMMGIDKYDPHVVVEIMEGGVAN